MLRFVLVCVAVWILSIISIIWVPPLSETVDPVFYVEPGETVSGVAHRLAQREFIYSAVVFRTLVEFGFGNVVHAGVYVFDCPRSLYAYARELATNEISGTPKKIRVLEGSNRKEIAGVLKTTFPLFDTGTFMKYTQDKEGYLYPDTYYFPNGAAPHPRVVIDALERTFEKKVAQHREVFNAEAHAPLKTFDDVINLAAIVELEASRQFDRRQIAGVLLNRLKQGIPLQVDVPFRAINGKNTFLLSKEDLRMDHPLNTYNKKGLPSHPIGNPSVASIDAVLNPVPTSALYFLADRVGNTYFSETHEEHIRKKAQYLK